MAKCKDLTELSGNTEKCYKKVKHTVSEKHPVYKQKQTQMAQGVDTS